MSALLAYTTEFKTVTCCQCSMAFALNAYYYDRRLQDGKFWYCPEGHRQHFTKTTVMQLKEQLEREEKRRAWAESEAKNLRKTASSLRGQITKTKNRIKNGVCPCCNRTFINLQKHMKTKHPQYTEEK